MTTDAERNRISSQLFPAGIPRLWCPVITHYMPDGSIDTVRMERHIRALAPYIGGLLVPGSTGDGWELPRAMKLALLDMVLPLAATLRLPVLAGLLERTTDDMLSFADALGSRIRPRNAPTARRDTDGAAACGIVCCAPTGAGLDQDTILDGLSRVLDLGLPTALYQLPQITGNLISPATAAALADRFANFVMLKDSGGNDEIALAAGTRHEVDLGGVFLVRGAETAYASWYEPAGPYNGFLLSTANWLAPQLARVVAGTADPDLNSRIDAAVNAAFGLVAGYPTGNAFANSARLMDQVMAYGARAATMPGPCSRDGTAMPESLVAGAVAVANAWQILPARGYAET